MSIISTETIKHSGSIPRNASVACETKQCVTTKKVWLPDRGTDGQTPDKVIHICWYTSHATQRWVFCDEWKLNCRKCLHCCLLDWFDILCMFVLSNGIRVYQLWTKGKDLSLKRILVKITLAMVCLTISYHQPDYSNNAINGWAKGFCWNLIKINYQKRIWPITTCSYS